MRTLLTRALVVLMVPGIAWLGAACDRDAMPTEPAQLYIIPPVCPPNDDDDDDGLNDLTEGLLGTLLGVVDSDYDGIVDGNDDANGNGEDDEDEDDDDDCPDDDDDGDGTDNEDEDDNNGDDDN
jgi:hypothetical protein